MLSLLVSTDGVQADPLCTMQVSPKSDSLMMAIGNINHKMGKDNVWIQTTQDVIN